MLRKKNLLIIGGVCFLIGAIFLYLHTSSRRVSEEVKPHLKKLYALSGELTLAQKQEYIEIMAAIQAVHNQTPLPDEEARRVLQHAYTLSMSNPELIKLGGMIEDKAHGNTHEHNLTEQERIQKRLDASVEDILSNPIPKPQGFTPQRFEKATRTLAEKGMRSLEKIDPDMAKYLKQLITP